jgi:hypothetical protein
LQHHWETIMTYADHDPDLIRRIAAAVARLRGPDLFGFEDFAPGASVSEITMDIAMLRIDGARFEGTMRITLAMPSDGSNCPPTLSTQFGDFSGFIDRGEPHITVAALDLDGEEATTPTPEERRGSFRVIQGGR